MTNSSKYYALKKTTCMIIQQLLEEGRQLGRITASKHKRVEGPLRIWYSEVSVKCEWWADWQTHGVYVKYATVQGDWLTKRKDGVTMDGWKWRALQVCREAATSQPLCVTTHSTDQQAGCFLSPFSSPRRLSVAPCTCISASPSGLCVHINNVCIHTSQSSPLHTQTLA